MNLAKLKQDRLEALNAAKALHALAATGNRAMTPEEGTQYDAHMANVTNLDANIARESIRLEGERTAEAVAGAVVGHNNAEDQPWVSNAAQLIALRNHTKTQGRVTDVRIQAALGSSESVDSDGGILVDPEYTAGIWQRTYDSAVLASRCLTMPMTRERMIMKAVDENSRADGSRFGGVLSYWTAEAGAYQYSKAKFRAMEIVANKLTVLTSATEEELGDAPALQAYNDLVVPQELAFKVDTAIASGPGAGQPLGFISSGATVVVPYDAGQTTAANPYTTNNLLTMIARLYARSVRTAAFFINQAALPYLRNLTIGTGTAVRLLFTPATKDDIQSGIVGYIEGFPVVVIEQSAAVGTQGDIMLADLQSYLLARRSGIRADSSIHVAFITGEEVFRWQTRLDGQPMWIKPLAQFNGGPSVSPFVALQTRP